MDVQRLLERKPNMDGTRMPDIDRQEPFNRRNFLNVDSNGTDKYCLRINLQDMNSYSRN
jgi:hypothetical protein